MWAESSYWYDTTNNPNFHNCKFFPQMVLVSLMVGVALSAAPGWSIWKNGMWDLSDSDNDNIPGTILS